VDSLTDAAQHVLAAIRARRSAPHVLPEAPPREAIELLLDAARYAPNHYLTHPWRFFVLTGDARRRLGDAALQGLRERWPLDDHEKSAARERTVPAGFLRAPVVIAVAAAPPAHPHTEPWEEVAATAAAIQNMLLAAYALGLAAYWRSNGTQLDSVRRFLHLEPGAQLLAFVYVGYPDPDHPPPPKPRQPHTSVTTWLD
jgi:nitroreductase